MELKPASMAQVMRGRDGRLIPVTEDVGGIVQQIGEISPDLRVNWNEFGEYFVVYEQCKDGRERIVTTCQELDGRLLERLRLIGSSEWDAVGEMERMDAQADRAKEHQLHEEVGPRAEVMAHALRKDLEHKGKVFVPKEVP